MKATKPFNFKIFAILMTGSLTAALAALPYTLELEKAVLEKLPVPIWVVAASSLVQSTILLAIAIGSGLFLAGNIGLGLPILEAKLRGEAVGDKLRAILPISILTGVLVSILIIGLDATIFSPALRAELGAKAAALNLRGAQPAAWKGLLASFYGGIDEEVLLRLFLMTLLAWLGKFLSKDSAGHPTGKVFWVTNILAAVLFGLAHLPATATMVPLTPLVVARAVVLNGLGGVMFGYLYWKRGLEAAMISHFSADIVLHVLLAL